MKLHCHCKAINIEVSKAPESLTSCNCSICNRYGSLWGYYHPSEVLINSGTSSKSTYSWGEETINFIRCSKCGCATHYEATEKAIIAVNFRMTEPSNIKGIPVRKFDGADTWSFLD